MFKLFFQLYHDLLHLLEEAGKFAHLKSHATNYGALCPSTMDPGLSLSCDLNSHFHQTPKQQGSEKVRKD